MLMVVGADDSDYGDGDSGDGGGIEGKGVIVRHTFHL